MLAVDAPPYGPLSDVHRTYWAIASKRYTLARYFCLNSASPIVCSLTASFAMRNCEHGGDTSEGRRNSIAKDFDRQCVRYLDCFDHCQDSRELLLKMLREHMYYEQDLYCPKSCDLNPGSISVRNFLSLNLVKRQDNRSLLEGCRMFGFEGPSEPPTAHFTKAEPPTAILQLAVRARSVAHSVG